jgi:DNA-binding MarR family transcriptional regulator
MRDQGWIEEAQSEDRRGGGLAVTKAGGALLDKAFPAWQRAQAQAKALLDEQTTFLVSQAVRKVQRELSVTT